LARAPGGTPASVSALEPRLVADHYATRFGPRTTVLAVVGACTADEVRTALVPLPAAPTTGVAPPDPPKPPLALGARSLYHPAPTEVTHLAVAVPVPGMTDPDRSALRLLDYILGRGGSSRLHRELRERRALTYTCSSVFMPYGSAGVFAAQAVCAPQRAGEVQAVLRESLLGLSLQPPTAEELKAAQQRYAGALYRTFETNANLAQILAVETLLAEWEPFDASVARIEAVTPAAVADAAARYLVSERLVGAALGPVDPAGS
jgi:predicted Zn-dependent peptidase